MKPVVSVLAVVLCAAQICALAAEASRPILLPTPKKVEWLDGRATVSGRVVITASSDKAVACAASQIDERLQSLGADPAEVVTKLSDGQRAYPIIWLGTRNELGRLQAILGKSVSIPGEACVPDGYVLRCENAGGRDIIVCAGYDARGCYYGAQTLIQLMSASRGAVSIPRVDIIDWPTFRIRLVKTSPGGDKQENVARWVELMPRYKANVLAAQFQPVVDTGTWREPSKRFIENSETVGRGARDSGTYDALMYLGPFGKDRGSLTDPKVIDDYVGKLLHWISRGYSWVGVDFNDWYVEKTANEEEREKIGDLGDVMSFLTNEAYRRVREKHPGVGFVTCPCNGHYKNATPEVVKFCKSIPEDILVISAGEPTKKGEYSGPVRAQFLKDWAEKTGRKPFFWDNCLYRQLDHLAPFINRIYNFDSYANRFPPNFADLLGGPGIHLNGSAKKWWEPGVLTFLDYAWNPEAYNAEQSLRKARVMLWGEAAADAAAEAQKTTAEFYGYLYGVHQDPTKADRAEADQKFAGVQKAVDRLNALLRDPVIKSELDEQCLGRAKEKLNAAFAPAKPVKRPRAAK